jgi:hypothetical protein
VDVARTGTLTFAPGDGKKEANDPSYFDLFGFSNNALFTKNRVLGTILNDD